MSGMSLMNYIGRVEVMGISVPIMSLRKRFRRGCQLLAVLSISLSVRGQERTPDSLVALLSGRIDDTVRVDLLNRISVAYYARSSLTGKDSGQAYSAEAQELARAIQDTSGLARALYNSARFEIGVGNDLSRATPFLLESLSLYEAIHDAYGSSNCYMQLGLISYMLEYYEDAVRNFKLSNALRDNATSTYLMALSYTELDSFPQARMHFSRAVGYYEALEQPERLDECNIYLGRLFVKMNELDSAFIALNKAIESRKDGPDRFSLERPYAFISEVYLRSNDPQNAIRYALASYELELQKTNEVRDDISLVQASSVLSQAYAQLGDHKKAYFFLDLYNRTNNVIAQGSTKQKIADMRSMFDFQKRMGEQRIRQQKDKEIAEGLIQREKILRNSFIGGTVLLLLLLIGLYNRFQFKRRANLALEEKNAIITAEKKRSDDLLLNILPEEVAEELKEKGEAEARAIENVTILFTDFKEFTSYSERVTAKELVNDLHECFTAFDNIIARHGMEKIKTIGDAYMAAGGLPAPNDTHAADVIRASLEIRDFIANGKAHKVAAGLPYFEIRLGIHTGPVVAGIVGVRKFSYDIWGDTVNTAARMESSGVEGRVNISESTYELVKDESDLVFTHRGKVDAKGKGEMDMFFVERKAASV